MLLGGDELSRTQGGNNNAWCQDNEISWFDWEAADEEMLAFTRRLIALRQEHPVFRRDRFLTGRSDHGSGLPDVWWFRADGRRMTQRDWQRGDAHTLGVFLNGLEIGTRDLQGRPLEDDSFLLLFNAYFEPVTFTLPTRRFGRAWIPELETADPGRTWGEILPARAQVRLADRALLLLRRA
jgi:glycogen operon protein